MSRLRKHECLRSCAIVKISHNYVNVRCYHVIYVCMFVQSIREILRSWGQTYRRRASRSPLCYLKISLHPSGLKTSWADPLICRRSDRICISSGDFHVLLKTTAVSHLLDCWRNNSDIIMYGSYPSWLVMKTYCIWNSS